jgi:ATP-dependent DNA ligase
VGTDFLDTVSQLRKKTGADLKHSTVLQVFDMVALDDFRNADNKTYFGGTLSDRLMSLSDHFVNFDAPPSVQFVAHEKILSWSHAEEMADSWMSMGLEGGIFKNANSGYIKRRSFDWLKIKLEDDITARIIAVYEGEAGKQFEGMLGGVTVEIDGVRSDVGGGWTNAERAKIWAAETDSIVPSEQVAIGGEPTSVVAYFPDSANKVIGRLIDIRSNGKTPSGALRHARKTKFRDVDGAIA